MLILKCQIWESMLMDIYSVKLSIAICMIDVRVRIGNQKLPIPDQAVYGRF